MTERGKRAPSLAEEAAQVTKKKEAAAAAKTRAATLETQFRKAEARLFERMDSEGVKGIKVGDVNYVPAETLYSSVNDRDVFVEWAEEHAPHLLKASADKGLLSEEIRRRIDDGEPPPPGTGFYVKQYISQRAA